jgi:hypothetical protein
MIGICAFLGAKPTWAATFSATAESATPVVSVSVNPSPLPVTVYSLQNAPDLMVVAAGSALAGGYLLRRRFAR